MRNKPALYQPKSCNPPKCRIWPASRPHCARGTGSPTPNLPIFKPAWVFCMPRWSRPPPAIAVLRLIFTPHLTHQGGWRATVEGVRVDARHRGAGLGRQLFARAIERARARGCHQLQLSTDKQRPKAKRFYEQLGFVATHEGMKLKLDLATQVVG